MINAYLDVPFKKKKKKKKWKQSPTNIPMNGLIIHSLQIITISLVGSLATFNYLQFDVQISIFVLFFILGIFFFKKILNGPLNNSLSIKCDLLVNLNQIFYNFLVEHPIFL